MDATDASSATSKAAPASVRTTGAGPVTQSTLLQRLVLIDPTLRDALGHNLDYARLVVADAHKAGLACRVISHAQARIDARLMGCEVTPWFAEGHKDVRRFDRLSRELRRMVGEPAWRAARRVRSSLGHGRTAVRPGPIEDASPSPSYIADLQRLSLGGFAGPHDRLFFPNLHWNEAAFTARMARPGGGLEAGEVQIVLRFDPPATGPGRKTLRDGAAASDRTHWFCDTQELARAYGGILEKPVGCVRIPIDGVALRGAAALHRQNEPITVLYLGESRREKGFHFLPQILEEAWTKDPKLRFIVQVSPNIAGGEPEVLAAAQALRKLAGPKLKLLLGALAPSAFCELLGEGHLLLLPYAAAAYRARSSGLLVQGLAAGLRIIAPSEPCWLTACVQRSAAMGQAYLAAHAPSDYASAIVAAASATRSGDLQLPEHLFEETLPAPWAELGSLPSQRDPLAAP